MIQLIFRSSLALVLSCFLIDSKNYASSDAEGILKLLKDQGLISQDSTIKKEITPGTSKAAKIIFVKDPNKCKNIIKIFKTAKEAEIARHSANAMNLIMANVISSLSISECQKIPEIIIPHGFIQDGNINVQQKAKGKPLSNYDIYTMSDQDISAVLSEVGRQTGTLEHLVYVATSMTLLHPDSHGNNVFYDEKDKKVYWIDIDKIELTEVNDIDNLNGNFYFSWLINDRVSDDRTLTRLHFKSTNKGTISENDFEDLSPEEKQNLPSMISDVNIFKKETLEILKKLKPAVKKEFLENGKASLNYYHKKVVGATSYGKAYVAANPMEKKEYNTLVEVLHDNYENIFHYMEIMGWQEPKLPSPYLP